MNTLWHPAEKIGALSERLAQLAAADSASADFLRPFLDNAGQPTPDCPAAKEQISVWIKTNALGNSPHVIILPGTGNACELQFFCEELPQPHRLFWMESDPQKAAEVFLLCPIEKYIAGGRLQIALGRDARLAERRFMEMWKFPQVPRFAIYDQTGIDQQSNAFYNEVLHAISKSALLDIFNIGTLVCRGGLWQNNTITNLPVLLRNPGIAALANIFPDKPALIVGAGPSLNAVLPRLADCAKGFVIISTGTALHALLRNGIRPDLVVAVDAHPLTASQFPSKYEDLYLACSTLVFPSIPGKFRGIFAGTLDANPIDHWLDKLTEERGGMLAAGTVTSTALDLAVKMGCNPIVSVGFDLSLAEDGTTHAKNTMYHGIKVRPDYHQLTRVPGNYSATVLTTPQFRNYIFLLEKYIALHQEQNFISVTGAGAKIKGMAVVPPARLAEFAAPPFNAAGKVAQIHQSFARDDSAAAVTELTAHLSALDKAAGTARQAARICNELLMMPVLSGPEALKTMERLSRELELADRALQDMRASSFLLEMSLWPVYYWLNTHQTSEAQSCAEVVAVYKRWRYVYEQIAGAAMWTRDVIKQVKDNIGQKQPAQKECHLETV